MHILHHYLMNLDSVGWAMPTTLLWRGAIYELIRDNLGFLINYYSR
jgi:hypothetical protein